jgi:hypothetical protein
VPEARGVPAYSTLAVRDPDAIAVDTRPEDHIIVAPKDALVLTWISNPLAPSPSGSV